MREQLTQSLRRAAQIRPHGVATIYRERSHTWRELKERIARLAGALKQHGVAPGDRVALLALNSDRYLEVYFAVPWGGGVIVPLNPRLSVGDLQYMLNDAGVRILCIDDYFVHLSDELKAGCPELSNIIYIGDTPDAHPELLPYEALLARCQPAPDAGRSGDDLAGIFYTGGSTGRPKGVMLSHRNLVTNAVNACYLIGYDQSSIFLHAAPMCHLTDGMSTVAITMAAGTHVMIPKFDPAGCLEAAEAHKVTHLTLVPTMIAMLLEVPGVETRDFSHLRQIMFGSAPIPDAVLRRAVEVWPHMRFLHGWGMTELSPIGTMLPAAMRLPSVAGERLRSCGQVMPNIDLLIVDPEGNEVPRGTPGEIIVRGPTVMLGYWNKPQETAAVLRDGWLHTGDVAYMDDDGYVYIVDRLKDMVISGGENVYSTEVENVISLMPGIAEVAVIGIPHPKWGEAVHAIVVPREGVEITEEAVIAYTRERLAAYKCPRSVTIRMESLPMSGAGKVLKSELRAQYWTHGPTRI